MIEENLAKEEKNYFIREENLMEMGRESGICYEE